MASQNFRNQYFEYGNNIRISQTLNQTSLNLQMNNIYKIIHVYKYFYNNY